MLTICYFVGLLILAPCVGTLHGAVYGMMTIGVGFIMYALVCGMLNYLNVPK